MSFPVARHTSLAFIAPIFRIRSWSGWQVALVIFLGGCATQPGFYHTVEPGQTLYRISRAYQVDEHHLARINGIDDPTTLRVGQRLYIPEGTEAVPVPKEKPTPPAATLGLGAAEKPVTAPPSGPARGAGKDLPSRKTTPVPPAKASPVAPAVKPPASRAPEKGRFQWPLKGTLLRGFGADGGVMSKGIEIASPVGSAVHSAGAGRVIYSSDGVAGYGNLIIIRHDDGFFSVYGFNKKNLVAVGTFVSRGERIALSGTPPGGGSPRLHFEIRNGKDAVDPIFYLP